MRFVDKELYGGAVCTKIPHGLIDASQLRQIPDTQEVFLNMSSNESDPTSLYKDDSLIVELLERIDSEDRESVIAHLAELSNLNAVGENEWEILKYDKIELASFP